MRITGIDVAKRCEVIRRPEFAPTDGVFAMSIDKRLTALGLTLPPVFKFPSQNRTGCVQSENQRGARAPLKCETRTVPAAHGKTRAAPLLYTHA